MPSFLDRVDIMAYLVSLRLEFKFAPVDNGVGDECARGAAVVALHEGDQDFYRYFLVGAHTYGATGVEDFVLRR